MPSYSLRVNGKVHQVEVAEDTPVLWVLRDHIKLLGTKYGCGIGQCGAGHSLDVGVGAASRQ